MRNLMLKILILGGLAASVQSAPTYFTDTYNFGTEGIIWDSQNQSWAEYRDRLKTNRGLVASIAVRVGYGTIDFSQPDDHWTGN